MQKNSSIIKIKTNRFQKYELEKVEYHDDASTVEEKIDELAQLVRDAENVVVFTGTQFNPNTEAENFKIGFPTKSHMALRELTNRGIIQGVVTQNIEGLHRKSGLPRNKLFELNGNNYIEVCETCKTEYERDFKVVDDKARQGHKTNRVCDNKACGGQLNDNVILPGEQLSYRVVKGAVESILKADLIICLGANLTDMQACQIPLSQAQINEQKGEEEAQQKIAVISNRKFQIDQLATLKIHTDSHKVIEQLMQRLEIQVPKFTFRRWADIDLQGKVLKVNGIDKYGQPLNNFRYFLGSFDSYAETQKVHINFHCHYVENNLTLYVKTKILEEKGKIRLSMVCDPNCISDDRKQAQFGYWDQVIAYVPNQDGSKFIISRDALLVSEQAPFKPQCASKQNAQTKMAKPFLFQNTKNYNKLDSQQNQSPTQFKLDARASAQRAVASRITAVKKVSGANRTVSH